MLNSTEIKPGTCFTWENELYQCIDISLNKTAMAKMKVKVKVKVPRTGVVKELSLIGSDQVGEAHIDKRAMQYLYDTGDAKVFMDKETYKNCFGEETKNNSFIINTKGKDVERLKEKLNTVEGFKAYSDYYEITSKSYQAFASISKAMVGVYTVLSVAMVFLVLLNLLMLFINEKKRELIVLMINGFTVKQAKKYIYSDTIFLTVIANALGCVFGSVMGNLSIKSFESESTVFIHRIDSLACLIGVACSVIMTFIVSMIALKKIDKFRLSDINNQ